MAVIMTQMTIILIKLCSCEFVAQLFSYQQNARSADKLLQQTYEFLFYFPATILLISFSLFSASSGVRLFTSSPRNLITHLTKYGVFQLEEAQLHALL